MLCCMSQFLGQRKKQEVEERRIKQKKAREEFRKMLEVCFSSRSLFDPIHAQFSYLLPIYDSMQESTEVTSSMRWRLVFYHLCSFFIFSFVIMGRLFSL